MCPTTAAYRTAPSAHNHHQRNTVHPYVQPRKKKIVNKVIRYTNDPNYSSRHDVSFFHLYVSQFYLFHTPAACVRKPDILWAGRVSPHHLSMWSSVQVKLRTNNVRLAIVLTNGSRTIDTIADLNNRNDVLFGSDTGSPQLSSPRSNKQVYLCDNLHLFVLAHWDANSNSHCIRINR